MGMQFLATMDVTKILEDMQDKQTCHCSECGRPYERKKLFTHSKGIWLPTCECEANEQNKIIEFKNRINDRKILKERYKKAGFPLIMQNSKTRLKNLDCENIEEAKEFTYFFRPKRAKGFHYVGSVGNGKTTLAVAIGKEVIKKGFSVRFMTFSQCMRILQSTYGHKNPLSFDEQMAEFLKIDLLILDDFGRDGYKEQKLADAFEFLNALYNNRSNVILTSNPEMIEKVKSIPDFGAMLDRFHKMARYRNFKKASYRREVDK